MTSRLSGRRGWRSPREGFNSPNPGRFAKRRPPRDPAADLTHGNAALSVDLNDIRHRARRLDIDPSRSPTGELVRAVALAEARERVGHVDAAAMALPDDPHMPLTERAAVAASAGARPEAAILAALAQTP